MRKIFGVFLALLGGISLASALVIFILLFNQPLTGFLLVAFLIGGFLATRGGLRLFKSSGDYRLTGSKEENHGGLSTNATMDQQAGHVSFSYYYQPKVRGKNGKPSQLTISVVDNWGIPFLARGHKGFDSFGAQLGLSIPLVTEDDSFNQQVYIETNLPHAMELYLSKPANRQAILEILGNGFEKVTCSANGMEAVWTGYQPEKRDTLADREDTALRLTFLSQGGHGIQDPETLKKEEIPSGHVALLGTTLATLLVGVFVVSIAVILIDSLNPPAPLRLWDLFSLSWKCLAVLFPGYLFLTFFYLRGRTTSHRDWLKCGILGLLVQAGFLPWTLHLVNVWADASPQVVFKGKILSLKTQKNKHSTSYHVNIPSRTDPVTQHSFAVSAQEFQTLKPGDPFELITRPGRLGIEWVVSFKPGAR